MEIVDEGGTPEYDASAKRYFGEEGGTGWTSQIRGMTNQWTRITVTPEWVSILDFEQRFPKAIAAMMAGTG